MRLKDYDYSLNSVYFIKRYARKTDNIYWQKSYHDHIIRNQDDYLRIWNHINENPAKWANTIVRQMERHCQIEQ